MSESHPLVEAAQQRLALPPEVCTLIAQRHGEPHRHYHTLRHLDLMLDQVSGDHPFAREMLLATLFHDIVYDPARSDNEEKSLAAFLSVATAFAPDAMPDTALVGEMILATRGHHFRDNATAGDKAVNLLLKADLSILWHPDPAIYAWYADGVRQEYSFVPEDAFRKARAGILLGLRADLLSSGQLAGDEASLLARNVSWELDLRETKLS